ncbi:MAG: Ig-like domain-containing protein [Muribaculaceae bacterium]|nr:Ig-like domain-containing protein [Muribaculaceae bacterium]
MMGSSRHFPLYFLLVMMLMACATSCGSDEPYHHMPGRENGHDTPADTTHGTHTPADTTAGDTTARDTTARDTSASFSIKLSSPRDYAYMGQTLRLTATTSTPTTVKWKSTATRIATVDSSGLVTFNNLHENGETAIIATACDMSDTLWLHARWWTIAERSATAWITPATHTFHPGDTIALTIVDSNTQPVNDNGFNAGSCQWTIYCYAPDVAQVINMTQPPSNENGWQAVYAIGNSAPIGTTFTIMAQFNEAASSITCTILP